MELGLCMIVRNEEERLIDCLSSIHELFDDIVVVDTGSRDRTREVLADAFGIEALTYPAGAHADNDLGALRSFAQEHVGTPWVLRLDPDERISPESIRRIKGMPDDPRVSGYFGGWLTPSGDRLIEDYKLFVHRREVACLGAIHENHQIDLRDRGESAVWLEGLKVEHQRRDPRVEEKKQQERLRRLVGCMRSTPEWFRFHWFAGLILFERGELRRAVEFLEAAARSRSARFPVECLNSCMVLCEIYARSGEGHALRPTLQAALSLLDEWAADFEVGINRRLRPWFEAAADLLAEGRASEIRAYGFSH